MMDWTKIGTALLLAAMLIYIFPRMRHALKHSPKGTTQDWMGVLWPILAVAGFVILLIQMVR
jgi:hypothetical protein